jgi:hypothetical protein
MTTKLEESHIENEKHLNEHYEDVGALETGRVRRGANTQLDDAAKLLADAGGHIDYSAEDSKRVLRKIDFYVCAPMCLIYFIQQVSVASLEARARADRTA